MICQFKKDILCSYITIIPIVFSLDPNALLNFMAEKEFKWKLLL